MRYKHSNLFHRLKGLWSCWKGEVRISLKATHFVHPKHLLHPQCPKVLLCRHQTQLQPWLPPFRLTHPLPPMLLLLPMPLLLPLPLLHLSPPTITLVSGNSDLNLWQWLSHGLIFLLRSSSSLKPSHLLLLIFKMDEWRRWANLAARWVEVPQILLFLFLLLLLNSPVSIDPPSLKRLMTTTLLKIGCNPRSICSATLVWLAFDLQTFLCPLLASASSLLPLSRKGGPLLGMMDRLSLPRCPCQRTAKPTSIRLISALLLLLLMAFAIPSLAEAPLLSSTR